MLSHLARMACALLLTVAAGRAHAAIDPDDVLPVDDAFGLEATASDGGIAVRWRIADGYYLYRHRTEVRSDAGFAAGALRLPKGTVKTDEFFGRVETYRKSLTATLPGTPAAATTVLTVKYQGCADAGICYPPQTRRITVALPGAATASASTAGTSLLGSRPSLSNAAPLAASRGLLPPTASGVDALPLPAEQAFAFEAIARDANTLLLRWQPARGYYLYRDRTSLRLDAAARAAGVALQAPRWPKGQAYRDPYFGTTTIYFDTVEVAVPVRRTRPDATSIRLTATFQGCQLDGICYPPMTRVVDVALPAGGVIADGSGNSVANPGLDPLQSPTGLNGAASPGSTAPAASGDDAAASSGTATDPGDGPATGASSGRGASDTDGSGASGLGRTSSGASAAMSTTAPPQAEDTRLAALLGGNKIWALAVFFGFGLLLAFTPCVWPMVPILSGLIAGHSTLHGGVSTSRAFALSSVYVLANAAVFTVAGVVAGLLGANLQIAFQTPWVIVAFAALFVALALSSFGLFELQLPSAVRSRLGALTDSQRGGSWSGVAVMGALSALIVGPCVAPPLAAAVLYIGQARDPVFGGAALFALALGMGTPLVAFGVLAGRGLPTSGPWMLLVQRVFGLVFIGLAIWMLSRLLPGPATLALWGLLAVGAAAMFGLFGTAAQSASPSRPWLRALGAVLALIGAAQLVGALAGGDNPLRPLASLGSAREETALPFRTIKTNADLDAALASATPGQPVLLDFYADWCVSCKEMERDTFPRPEVQAALAGMVLLKADVTANDAADQALMTRLGIIGPPATLYFRDGVERRELRLFGFEAAPAFAERGRRAAQ